MVMARLQHCVLPLFVLASQTAATRAQGQRQAEESFDAVGSDDYDEGLPHDHAAEEAASASLLPAAVLLKARNDSAVEKQGNEMATIPLGPDLNGSEAGSSPFTEEAIARLVGDVAAGVSKIEVDNQSSFQLEDTIRIGSASIGKFEIRTVVGLGSLVLDSPLINSYSSGTVVALEHHSTAAAPAPPEDAAATGPDMPLQVSTALQGTAPDGRLLERFFRTQHGNASEGSGLFALLYDAAGNLEKPFLAFSSYTPLSNYSSSSGQAPSNSSGEALDITEPKAPPVSWFKATFGREASEVLVIAIMLVVAGAGIIWAYKGQRQMEEMNGTGSHMRRDVWLRRATMRGH